MDFNLRGSYLRRVDGFLLPGNILYRSYRNAHAQLHALTFNAPLLITANFLTFSLSPNTPARRWLIKAAVKTTKTA
jgi:hypothetical protein